MKYAGIATNAPHHLEKGYYTGQTIPQIKVEISRLENEIKRADKRTYNGKMTKIFNGARINFGLDIIAYLEELEGLTV
jgi:hypothetical protein